MSRSLNDRGYPLFLSAAIAALRLQKKWISLFPSEARLFKWHALAAGKLDLFEWGKRHEVWEALSNLEFLLRWPHFGRLALSSGRMRTASASNPDAPFLRTPFGGFVAGRHLLLRQEEKKTQEPGKSMDRGPWLSTISVGSPDDRRSMPAPAAWPRLAQERGLLVKWVDRHRVGAHQHEGGVDEQEEIPFSLRPSLKGDGNPPLYKQLGNLDITDGLEAGADRLATMPLPFSPVSFSTGGAERPTTEEIEGAQAAERGETADFNWRFLVSQSEGTPLGIFQRVRLEPFFSGINLGEVRIHADEPADRAARALRADAFSLGRNIYFRARKFNPTTPTGLALLGHELVHTRQMINAAPFRTSLQREGLEREAERAELSLIGAFSLSGASQDKEQAFRPGVVGNHYHPIQLDPLRRSQLLPGENGGRRGGGGRSVSLSTLSSGEHPGGPLRAEEGRAAVSGAAASASPSPSPDDTEGMARTILRALERKIQIEKERRGVDRWVH